MRGNVVIVWDLVNWGSFHEDGDVVGGELTFVKCTGLISDENVEVRWGFGAPSILSAGSDVFVLVVVLFGEAMERKCRLIDFCHSFGENCVSEVFNFCLMRFTIVCISSYVEAVLF